MTTTKRFFFEIKINFFFYVSFRLFFEKKGTKKDKKYDFLDVLYGGVSRDIFCLPREEEDKEEEEEDDKEEDKRRSSYYEMTTRIDSILQKKNADGAEEATGCDHQKTTFRRRVT